MQFKTALPILTGLALGFSAAIAQPEAPKTPQKTAEKPAGEPAKKVEPKSMGDFPTTMPVPAAAAKLGKVYNAVSGRKTQITWTSGTGAEKIEGVSNNVIGYAIAGGNDNPAMLKAAEWSLPVKSMDTRNPERNSRIAGAGWLDADKNPNITFKLKEVKDAKEAVPPAGAKQNAHIKSFTATFVGDLSIHGVTKEVSIAESRIRFLSADAPNADLIASVLGSGDLMIITTKLPLMLADYGIKHDKTTEGDNLAEKIDIKMELVMNTGDAPAPKDKPAEVAKPKPAGS